MISKNVPSIQKNIKKRNKRKIVKKKIVKRKIAKKKIVKKKNKSKKYKFVVMAIFKNEEEYMEEWLEHHINQGISHFYLYCNDSNLNKYNYLKKYSDYIKLIEWTNKVNRGSQTIQKQAYTDCVKKYSHEYHYILIIDLDEFIINLKKNKRVIDYINTLGLSKTKAIKVPRFNFGSNGHIEKTKGKVMEKYTKHEIIYSSFKTIGNSKFLDNRMFKTVHDFNYLNKIGKIYNAFLDKKNKIKKSARGNKNETPLVINHYYTKSYEEYVNRSKLWENGGVNPVQHRAECKKKFNMNDRNEVEGYDYLTKKLKKEPNRL